MSQAAASLGRVQCPGSRGLSALPVGRGSYHPKSMATALSSGPGDRQRVLQDPVISTLMTSRVVAVGPDMALIDALRVMNSAGVRHLPVVEGGRCVGLLAEIDMLRQLVAHGLVRPESTALLTAGEGCRRPSPAVPVRATRATAAQLMLDSGSDAVLIMDDEHIHGIVTASDLAASLVESAASARAAEARSSGGNSPEPGS